MDHGNDRVTLEVGDSITDCTRRIMDCCGPAGMATHSEREMVSLEKLCVDICVPPAVVPGQLHAA